MTAFDWLIIILGIFSVIPCAYLYYKDKGNANKFLMILSLIAGPLWALTVVLFRNAASLPTLLLCSKFLYLNSVLLGASFFLFSQYFPKKNLHKTFVSFITYGIAILLTYTILFTDLFIETPILFENNSIILGKAYLLWMVWMLGVFSFGLIRILLNYKNLGKIERIQLKYFILAITVPTLGVVPSNAFLPLVGNFEYIWIGPLSMSIMSVLLALGITTKNSNNKYDIYILLIKGFFMMIYIYEITFLTRILLYNDRLIINSFEKFIWIAIFTLIASSSFYLGNILVKFIVKKAFKDKIPDYIAIRDRYLDITADILNANRLKEITIEQIMHSVSLEWCGIISIHSNGSVTTLLSNSKKPFIPRENFSLLITNIKEILDKLDNVCNRDYIIYILSNAYEKFSTKFLKRMKRVSIFLGSMNASEVLILDGIDNSKEVLLLGYKKDSAASINIKDRELINSLLKNLSLALLRANLHTQVETANTSLKQKVSEQTYELKQQLDELEKARKKERDMIDIMGHELRTPMSIIKLNTDLLYNFSINVTKKKESFTTYVTRIKDAVETEIKLINTLLSSAKLEGDRIELNYEKVNLPQQIKLALRAHETEAKQKGLQLTAKLSPNSTYIYADHARIVEILNNLIDNAVKYTNQGNVTIETEDQKDSIQISITDTGRGMSREDVSALGTKFFRTGNYIESESGDDFNIVRPGGTGLGLYITFNLIKKMGGEIHVESKLGEGTIFTFTLPKYTGQATKRRTNTKDMFTRLGLKEK